MGVGDGRNGTELDMPGGRVQVAEIEYVHICYLDAPLSTLVIAPL